MNTSVPIALAAFLLGSVAQAQTPPAATPPDAALPTVTPPTATPPTATPPAAASTTAASPTAVADKSDPTAKPDSLAVFFDLDSATIRPQDAAVLDKASRMYTDGKPTVMILTGSTDGLGQALPNLRLSQQRALAVLTQLVARGIPAERFQILAKGENDPTVPASSGVGEPRDRRVEIAWH